ncbi:LPS assembly lipoprotein LptE [Desulfobacula sp.]
MKRLKWILYGCLVVFFTSCGYQFQGGGYINKDVARVAVKVLENKSSETGAGIAFTNALIQEIIQRTDTKVVDESLASVFFKGTIKRITFATLSRSTTESVVDRRVLATIDLKLVNKDGEVIWSVTDFTSYEEYTVSADKITDESNKKEAVDKIAIRSAEKLINKLMINF